MLCNTPKFAKEAGSFLSTSFYKHNTFLNIFTCFSKSRPYLFSFCDVNWIGIPCGISTHVTTQIVREIPEVWKKGKHNNLKWANKNNLLIQFFKKRKRLRLFCIHSSSSRCFLQNDLVLNMYLSHKGCHFTACHTKEINKVKDFGF